MHQMCRDGTRYWHTHADVFRMFCSAGYTVFEKWIVYVVCVVVRVFQCLCVFLCLCLCLCLSVLYAINIVICREHTNIIYNITTASDLPYSYTSSLRPHTSV